MKKYLAIAFAALMVMSLAGCSNSTNSSSDSSSAGSTVNSDSASDKSDDSSDSDSNAENDVSPVDVEAAIAKALGDGYLSTVDAPEDELFSTVVSSIDFSQVGDYVIKQARVSAVNPDTVVVLKCKSGYADTAVDLINESYAQTLSYSRLYSFSVAKVEGARLYKFGDTVIFVIGGALAENGASAEDKAKLAASEYEKIDSAIKELFGMLPENLAVVTEPDDSNDNDDDNGFFNMTDDFSYDDDMPLIGGKLKWSFQACRSCFCSCLRCCWYISSCRDRGRIRCCSCSACCSTHGASRFTSC